MITGNDLITWGFPTNAGEAFGAALSLAQELEASGAPLDDIKTSVFGLVPKSKIEMKSTPYSWNEAIVAENDYDLENIKKVREVMSQLMTCPAIKRGAVMPDACPAGSQWGTIPVGGAIEVDNAIIPASHSADVCCSMYVSFFQDDRTPKRILDSLQRHTHFGAGGRRNGEFIHHPVIDALDENNRFLSGLGTIAAAHMGTQGDGNHFAYLGEIEITPSFIEDLIDAGYESDAYVFEHYVNEKLYALVTHHGSRALGAHVYRRGIDTAQRLTNKIAKDVPKTCAWIPYDTDEGKEYWDALQYIREWTKINHEVIHGRVVGNRSIHTYFNEHNFVWKRGDSFYHGKGATPAWDRRIGIIPLNMASPILLVIGKDNDDFLSFAPHGAGRNVSRTETLRPYMKENGERDELAISKAVAKQTEHLDIRWYSGEADLSETPMGYKSAAQIKDQINYFDLATVTAEITPLGCMMAGHVEPFWRKKK